MEDARNIKKLEHLIPMFGIGPKELRIKLVFAWFIFLPNEQDANIFIRACQQL